MKNYLAGKWALIRRNELVDVPEGIELHKDFLGELTEEEFLYSFRQIHDLFYQMYTDMAEQPECFGIPLYEETEVDYFSREAREVRTAPWKIFVLLLELFAWGELRKAALVVDMTLFRAKNQIKKTDVLLRTLEEYGFVFAGIKNGKLPSAGCVIEIDYPDSKNNLYVLSLVAKKVMNLQLKNVNNYFSHRIAFENGFIGWNYKLLEEGMDTCSVAEGCDYVADKMHTEAEREAVAALDKRLQEVGYIISKGDPNEGPSVRYSKGKGVYDFALSSFEGELVLELRIRNAMICMEYLKECPERILGMFRQTDTGCHNRVNGTCSCGVKYTFEDEEKWHCGCCGAPFQIRPVAEDVEHYMKLVELGKKR